MTKPWLSLLACITSIACSSSYAEEKPKGERPVVAILDQPDLPMQGMSSSPERIARVLQDAGFEVRRLSAAEFADAKAFNAARFDLAVVATGATFPVEARETMVQYLRHGGNLLATGGYAFNHLVRKIEGQWRPDEELARERLKRATAPERSLLPNGGFERSQEITRDGFSNEGEWHRAGNGSKVVTESPHEGRFAARTELPADSPDGAHFWCDLPAKPGATYEMSGWLRTKDVVGRGMAFIAMYQYDASGKLVEFLDFAKARGTTPWQRSAFTFTPKPNVARLHVSFGFYEAHGTAWFDDLRLCDITGQAYRPMNTATGRPEDGLIVAADQLGMFDVSFPLKRACALQAAPQQHVFTLSPATQKSKELAGWAASGVIGYDNARWIPLVMTHDRYGRPRGAAGAMTIHYSGPFASSIWTYFGLENVDVFSENQESMAAGMKRTMQFMARKMFLRNLAAERRLYRPNEPVRMWVTVENRGRQKQNAEVRFRVREASGEYGKVATTAVELAPGTHRRVEQVLSSISGNSSLYEIEATLALSGEPFDEMHSGFVVQRPELAKAGLDLRFSKNYFTLAGRPTFLFGSDDYSVAYRASWQNPLVWARELTAARDIGLTLYENLQYVNPRHAMSDDDWRNFAAMNQLVQERNMVFMPGMLIGHNVVVSDAELAEESELCRQYARELGGAKGLLWYINGDYQLDPGRNLKAVKDLWNRWLKSEYGDTEKLRAAWGVAAVQGELGNLEFPPPNSGRWDDVAMVDRSRFYNWLMVRWNQAHVAAVREHDKEHAITSEYYGFPFGGIDLIQTIDGQDVSNFGFFDRPTVDIDNLPLRILWNDLRVRGKGVSLGEYGVKTHPAWTEANGATDYHIVRTEEEQRRLFMAVAHYALGLGASKVQNWCLRDDSAHVFPWGLFYPNQPIPKDVAYAHRNQSLVWRHFVPVYQPPELVVCLANQLRLGNDESLGMNIGYRAFADLLALHYAFGVVDDDHLEQLSPTTKFVVFPAPFAMREQAYQKLLAWVRSGGTLLVTGDFSHDPQRRRSGAHRLKELAGVEFATAAYSPPSRALGRDVLAEFSLAGLGSQAVRPCIRVKPAGGEVLGKTAQGDPVLVRNTVDRGTVFYFADPIETAEGEAAANVRRQLYAAILKTHPSLPKNAVAPDVPWLHVMRQPIQSGDVYVAYNTRREEGAAPVELRTTIGQVRLGTRNGWPALAAVSQSGIVAVNANGTASVGSDRLLAGRGQKAVLSLDGKDLRQSEAMVVAPFELGDLELSARLQSYACLVGDFRDGRWVTFERQLRVAHKNGEFAIDADRATCLIVLCRPGMEESVGKRLTDAMALSVDRDPQ